jgi:hypothetical protein
MIDLLINAWKQVYATYLDKKINKIMYYYLVLCLLIVGGAYFYLYWRGCLGFSILFSVWAGAKLSTAQPPITIVEAIGMIIIIRYALLGGIDAVAKRTPDKMDERLTLIEDKLRDMHTLAFTGFLTSKRVREVRSQLAKESAARRAKSLKLSKEKVVHAIKKL